MQRWYWAFVAAVIALAAALQIASVVQEAQTVDEAVYLAAGVSYWTTGDERLNPEHPPLEKLISALPLLPLHLTVRTDTPLWAHAADPDLDEYYYAQDFLYNNRLPWQTILFAGRLPTIALTAVFAFALAWWTRRRAGRWASVIALTLFAFDPTVLAHGSYATNDLWVGFFIFIACVLWDRALHLPRSLPAFAIAGLALGCALGTKASAICLPFIFLGLAIARRTKWKDAAVGAAVSAVVALAFVMLLYRGSFGAYVAGFETQLNHFQDGHLAYLFGSSSLAGWWYYYPCVFLIKTPLATLVLAVIAVVLLVRKGSIPPDVAMPVLAIVTYAIFCLFSHVDIGARYLLPLTPMVFALIGIVVGSMRPRWPIAVALIAVAIESLAAFPNYLPFVNVAFGGPDQAPRYLLDSNVDWGQDTVKLKSWLDARGVSSICFAYFGAEPRSALGFTYTDVPATAAASAASGCNVIAASVHYLYLHDALAWLRPLTPTAKIGHSIYVYDLRK